VQLLPDFHMKRQGISDPQRVSTPKCIIELSKFFYLAGEHHWC